MSRKIKIGITTPERLYERYQQWAKGSDEFIELIELHWQQPNWDLVEECDGIILAGGVDVHPSYFGVENEHYPLAPEKFNTLRDEFEMHVLETAVNFKIPILGICRGLQLVNVALGGSLILDLEQSGKNDHKRVSETEDRTHFTVVTKGSLLHDIVQVEEGLVNSAHHQAVDKLSDELIAGSFSKDQVIESVEWHNKSNKPWMLCVQWHPERMNESQSPFSKNIREAFLHAILD